jgi:three-Cys-motif partner protein
MPIKNSPEFGGDWTSEKLGMVSAYLKRYTDALKFQPFTLVYVDAFAGAGYWAPKKTEDDAFFGIEGEDPKAFIEGSARVALGVEPSFHEFIFIEKNTKRAAELEQLKNDFPNKAEGIYVEKAEANEFLQHKCREDWIRKNRRAVLFLDPFGMQVEWKTIECIANTKAIDMWLLFPIGAVNRLLKKDGEINEKWAARLSAVLGTEDWRTEFYRKSKQLTLFTGEGEATEKTATFKSIEQFVVRRLKDVFVGVADNPYTLVNSRNSPLYLLCFAVGSKTGKPIALRIAQHILGNS